MRYEDYKGKNPEKGVERSLASSLLVHSIRNPEKGVEREKLLGA